MRDETDGHDAAGRRVVPGAADAGSPVEVTGAFDAARGLLEGAEAEAARIVAEAERLARARSQEADLLVAKARRLLSVAEDKAAAILAVARADAAALVSAQAGASAGGSPSGNPQASPTVGERTEESAAAPAVQAGDRHRRGTRLVGPEEPSSLDRVLAAAIASAVDRAFDDDQAG